MPKGPCPAWREAMAADTCLFASSFCGAVPVFDADETRIGEARRTAIERYTRSRAVKDLG